MFKFLVSWWKCFPEKAWLSENSIFFGNDWILKLNLKLKTGLNFKKITTKYIDIVTNTYIELKKIKLGNVENFFFLSAQALCSGRGKK